MIPQPSPNSEIPPHPVRSPSVSPIGADPALSLPATPALSPLSEAEIAGPRSDDSLGRMVAKLEAASDFFDWVVLQREVGGVTKTMAILGEWHSVPRDSITDSVPEAMNHFHDRAREGVDLDKYLLPGLANYALYHKECALMRAGCVPGAITGTEMQLVGQAALEYLMSNSESAVRQLERHLVETDCPPEISEKILSAFREQFCPALSPTKTGDDVDDLNTASSNPVHSRPVVPQQHLEAKVGRLRVFSLESTHRPDLIEKIEGLNRLCADLTQYSPHVYQAARFTYGSLLGIAIAGAVMSVVTPFMPAVVQPTLQEARFYSNCAVWGAIACCSLFGVVKLNTPIKSVIDFVERGLRQRMMNRRDDTMARTAHEIVESNPDIEELAVQVGSAHNPGLKQRLQEQYGWRVVAERSGPDIVEALFGKLKDGEPSGATA